MHQASWSASRRRTIWLSAGVALLPLAPWAASAGAESRWAAFTAANRDAMARMMAGMHQATSGDVDLDFARSMIAHHAGAVDMAKAQLLYGRDEQLRRLAQEIIVTQTDEIAVMQLAVERVQPRKQRP